MPTAPTTPASSASAEKQLAKFISKFDSKNQELIRSIRRALRKRLPTANELVWDNYNFFVIGYSATERPSDSSFPRRGARTVRTLLLPRREPAGSARHPAGLGVQNRFIRLDPRKTLARPEVEAVIAAAVAQMRVPLPKTGRGRLIIRSVSAKQRPRSKRAKKAPSSR
jgi:hypothetical protein